MRDRLHLIQVRRQQVSIQGIKPAEELVFLRLRPFFDFMITKAKKTEQVAEGRKLLGESDILIFTDFSKTKNEDLRSLRSTLKGAGAKFQVIKKRLLNVVFKERDIDFDPKQFESQVGTIFVKGDISGVAGPVYQFSKDKEGFKILGGLDVLNKSVIPSDLIISIGKLPSREVLLTQLAGVLISPLRAFMYVLSEKGRK
ncbi:MAG: 50S ribosomal protein L10 [Candidatus Colwellbacteria bacterium]|nr:50S ribosomal protein L10 [Candidatus Colwellbacteria bacterium]